MPHLKTLFFLGSTLFLLSFAFTNNGTIDLNTLDNYANQPIPNYINGIIIKPFDMPSGRIMQ